jgi:chemotaxis protein methyltransferase WspC
MNPHSMHHKDSHPVMNPAIHPAIHPILQTIAQQLKHQTGLDCQRLDLQGAVIARMQVCHALTLTQYADRLQTAPEEWQALIETIVIPETGFFRDRKPFEYLANWVQTTWIKRREPVLRVLSLPCSTGEEPYSIAMTLLNAGLNPAQIAIDGIDISARAIQVAQSGQYRSNHPIPDHGSCYWKTLSTGIEILPWVRRLVKFRVDNGLTVLSQFTAQPYDVIFCRNLLIYFDVATRQNMLQGLDRHLSRNGLLVVGHAEMGMIGQDRLTRHLSPVSQAHSCAFHPRVQPKAIVPPSPQVFGNRSERQCSRSPSSQVGGEPMKSGLTRARQLADLGDLAGAIVACELYLKQSPLCAEGHSLAAQIQLALDHPALAEQLLDRAIYLNPHHQDALLQLALLRAGRGDRVGSAAIEQRLKRLL